MLLLSSSLNGGFTHGIIEHLRAHLTDPQAGSFLGVVEVREQSAEVFPILDRGLDLGGKRSRAESLAAGALLSLSPMLGAFQFQGRQIEDLAALKVKGGFFGEILAALTLQQWVNLDVLGSVVELESAARVAGLAARFATGLFA